MPMPTTQKEMLAELYQAVIGIPENPEENGLIGDVKEVRDLLKAQNGRITKNERSISKFKGYLAGMAAFIGLASLVVALIQLWR